MLVVCAGACVCVLVCAYALRIVSVDKILRFKNTLVIIINTIGYKMLVRSKACVAVTMGGRGLEPIVTFYLMLLKRQL